MRGRPSPFLHGLHHWWGEPTGIAAAELALVHARRAVELERESPVGMSRLAMVLLFLARHDEALEAGHAAVRLNPASTDARLCLGHLLAFAGNPDVSGSTTVDAPAPQVSVLTLDTTPTYTTVTAGGARET